MASDWKLKKKIINRSLMTKLVSIMLVLASALLLLPSFSLMYPLHQKLGDYPSSEKTAGEWITISLENPVEMSFVASTDRLKSIYVNVQPLEGETFQDGEGYLITSIKYNGAVCTSVYQSLSDIQENKMQYIELDAKLKKNTSYQLCFEVLNTQTTRNLTTILCEYLFYIIMCRNLDIHIGFLCSDHNIVIYKVLTCQP